MQKRQNHLRILANQDGAAILNSQRGIISTLNPTGAFIWTSLENGQSIHAIAQLLSEQTGESIQLIRDDIAIFIDSLKDQGISPVPLEVVE
jgi:hypothetical protein